MNSVWMCKYHFKISTSKFRTSFRIAGSEESQRFVRDTVGRSRPSVALARNDQLCPHVDGSQLPLDSRPQPLFEQLPDDAVQPTAGTEFHATVCRSTAFGWIAVFINAIGCRQLHTRYRAHWLEDTSLILILLECYHIDFDIAFDNTLILILFECYHIDFDTARVLSHWFWYCFW